MSRLFELIERPELDSPVLVVVLDGWIDAGLGAQQARQSVVAQIDPMLLATFDTDALLDHRARRPSMRLANGVHAGLEWPGIELRAAVDAAGSEFLLLDGVEPDHQWRAFADAVADLALELGVRLVVGLGAYPAPVAHTRGTGLASTASSAELAEMVGYVPGTIEVPAGVQAAIEDRCIDRGIPAIGLWAQVPHYVAAMPYPGAAVALLDGLAAVAGLRFESGDLAELATQTRNRIDELVAQNHEHQEMVTMLEAQSDDVATGVAGRAMPGGEDMGPLPSGDELAAELERFLRNQDDDA